MKYKTGHKENVRHGHNTGRKSPTYITWDGMKQRCLNPNNKKYLLYGGRGITICDDWNIFDLFLRDMGERPLGKTIDRIDSDGNYEPGNCRWATPSEQNYNKKPKLISFNGRSLTLGEWAESLNLSKSAICRRLKQGWTLDEALTKKKGEKRGEYQEANAETIPTP